MMTRKSLLLIGAFLVSLSVFAGENTTENAEPNIGPVMPGQGTPKSPSKQDILKEITSIYNLVFGVDDFFARQIDFHYWSDDLRAHVRKFVKKHAHGDQRLLNMLRRINTANDSILAKLEVAFLGTVRSKDGIAHFIAQFNGLSRNLGELVDELDSVDTDKGLFHRAEKKAAKEVLKFFALHVENIARSAAKHLTNRR